jgi:hypothetical protein
MVAMLGGRVHGPDANDTGGRGLSASSGSEDTRRLCGGVQLAAPTTEPESVTHQKLGAAL